jgi:hypothetical protein
MLKYVKKIFNLTEVSTSIEIHHAVVEFAIKICRLIGCNMLSVDFSYTNIVLLLLVLDFVTYIPINLYDVYLFRENFVRCMFCVVTFPCGIQGGIKLYVFIVHRQKILNLMSIAENFHQISTRTRGNSATFRKWMLVAVHVFFFILILFIGIFILIVIYPIIVFIFSGNIILHYGFVLPFIDPEIVYGYALNFSHHVLQTFIVITGTMASVMLTMYYVIVILAKYDTLGADIDDLDIMIKSSTSEDKTNEKLADIIDQHNALIEYLEFFNDIFSVYYLIDIFCAAFQTGITLFTCSIDIGFLPGYTILLFTAAEIFAPCLLGTALEISCDKFYDKLVAFSWIDLPLSQQRTVLFMIQLSQKKRFMACGKVDLNLQLFVSVSTKVPLHLTQFMLSFSF